MNTLSQSSSMLDIVRDAPDASVPIIKPQPQKLLTCPQLAHEIRKFCQPSGMRHILFALPYVMVYLGGVAMQFFVNDTLLNVLLSLVIGNQLYVLFILHHDCMHGSAFR